MAKDLLDMILDSVFDDKWVGKHGEKLTERELKLVKLLGRKGKTLRNVYLPKENGETSEIDVMYITQKGIFVFESKNYSGWIFGNEKGTYWTAMLPNKQKNSFYNPVKQNRTHLKWLQKYVGDHIPLFSIIVFSERCELKKVEMVSPDIKVIKRDRTYATVRDIWDSHEDAVSDEDVLALYKNLKQLTNVDAKDSFDFSFAIRLAGLFPQELMNDLIPSVESHYSTYVKSFDPDGLRESRDHRGFGGFSMGSVATWHVFDHCLDYFRYFITMSGNCGDGSQQDESVKRSCFGMNDFFMFTATGTADFAYDGFRQQVMTMGRYYTDSFRFADTQSEGNLSYREKRGATHDYAFANQYIFNGLQFFWE